MTEAGHMNSLISSFHGALKSGQWRHRLTAVAFYAEIVRKNAADRADVDGVIRGLTGALPDSSHLIRRTALSGLASLDCCDPSHWKSLAPAVLDALMDGLEGNGNASPQDGGKI